MTIPSSVRKTCWYLAMVLCLGAATPLVMPPAPALAAAPASATAPVDGPAPEDGAAVQKWITARVSKAKKGQRELVRVQLVHRGDGWGCDCPEFYIGESTDYQNGAKTWLKPIFSKSTEALAEPERPTNKEYNGYIITVEGYFTGAVTRERFEGENYKMWDFQVLRARRDGSRRSEAKLQIVLSGPEAQREVPPLSDDRPWLVIGGDMPLFDANSQQQADELKKKLQAAGFAKIEVLDGRQAPNLFCCRRVVVVERFKTRQEAQAVAADARLKPFEPYVRRGF